jgi:hypothetical protein
MSNVKAENKRPIFMGDDETGMLGVYKVENASIYFVNGSKSCIHDSWNDEEEN